MHNELRYCADPLKRLCESLSVAVHGIMNPEMKKLVHAYCANLDEYFQSSHNKNKLVGLYLNYEKSQVLTK